MRYLLDTNVLSELRKIKSGRADPSVALWGGQVDVSALYTSVIVVQELEVGILRSERADPFKGAVLRRWLHEQVLLSFSERILPVDLVVAIHCAKLHVPNNRPYRDTLIAATGLVHHMTVVTRNTIDFEGTGVKLLNPWHFNAPLNDSP